MKSTRKTIETSLKQEILKSKNGFVCTVCLEDKNIKYKATVQNVCKTCRNKMLRDRYQASKTLKKCIKCGEISTNFSGYNNICRKCTQKYQVTYKKNLKKGLGEKLLILWKSGYPFDEAINIIKLGVREEI